MASSTGAADASKTTADTGATDTGATDNGKTTDTGAGNASRATGSPAAGAGATDQAVRRYKLVSAIALVVLVTILLLSRVPAFLEEIYAGWLGPTLVAALAGLTGIVPFSVAELLTVATLAWVVIPLVLGVARVAARGERGRLARAMPVQASVTANTEPGGTLRGVATREVLRILALLLSAAAMFYLAWGAYYARPPMVNRYGWEPYAAPVQGAQADSEELARLASELTLATNAAYVAATGSEDLLTPSTAPEKAVLEAALETGYEAAAVLLPVDPLFAPARGPAKPLLMSPLFSRMGLAGIYFPWTGEANYNRLMPEHQLPQSIAHEKAHQRGITGEDEANFVGYIAATSAPEPYVRYSGLLFAHRQLLRELLQRDEAEGTRLLAERLPGVQRDVDAGIAYWQQFQGPARDVQQEFNDRYLKFHGIEEGIGAYAESARLLVIYSRYAGGSVIPADPFVIR